MTRLRKPWRVGIITVVAIACVRTAPVPQAGYVVSSDASHYSPVTTLRIVPSREGSQLLIELDSGTLVVPGNFAQPAPIAVTNLYLTAYIAATNTGPMALALPDSLRFPDRRGWRAVATSDSIQLTDQLRYGERQQVGRHRLAMSLPAVTEGPLWLVFRISGKVVDHRMQFDERSGMRVGALGGTTRVYACSDRDLMGQLDTARSNGLKRAYGLTC